MILVLRQDCDEAGVQRVLAGLAELGLEGNALRAAGAPVVHVTSRDTRPARALSKLDEVVALVPTSGPRVRREGRRFYPYHFVRWSAFGIFLIALLVLLAGMFPPGRGRDIDPFEPLPQVEFSWYVRPVQMLVHQLPPGMAWVAWLAFWALVVLVLLLPYVDRTRTRGQRLPVLVVGLAVAAGLLVLAFGGLL